MIATKEFDCWENDDPARRVTALTHSMAAEFYAIEQAEILVSACPIVVHVCAVGSTKIKDYEVNVTWTAVEVSR